MREKTYPAKNDRMKISAPPNVYRPGPEPRCLQLKRSNQQQHAPSAPLEYRFQPIPRVLQPKIAAIQRSTQQVRTNAPVNVVQCAKKNKRFGDALSNWNKFYGYDTQSARAIEREVQAAGFVTVGRMQAEICRLMIAWNYDKLTIGHLSKNKTKKKNNQTDPACEQIRTSFFNYYGL